MAEWTLPVGAAIEATGAVVFLVVGRSFIKRAKGSASALPLGLFATWWCGVAAYAFTDATLGLLATFATPRIEVVVFLRVLSVVFLCAALGGLVAYVMQVYARSNVAIALSFTYYCAMMAVFAMRIAIAHPIGVSVGPWLVDMTYARPRAPMTVDWVVVLFMAPPLVALLAYLALLRRADGPTQRWRIALSATGILLWIASGGVARMAGGELIQVVTRVAFGAVVAAVVLAAYHPPASIARKWRLEPLVQRAAPSLDPELRSRVARLV